MRKAIKLATPVAPVRLLTCLLLLLYAGSAAAQGPVTITGVVKDKLNKPLEAVSVQVVGTQKGVATDSLGKFSIRLDNPKQLLHFSRVGYVAQTLGTGNSFYLD